MEVKEPSTKYLVRRGYKQTEVGMIPDSWDVKRLGDVIEKFIGGGTPSRSISHYWGDEIPWVTVKDFATFNPLQSQEAITRAGLQSSASHLIPSGTLITSTRMALGKAVIYDVNVAINQDLKALFPRPILATPYLYFWFQHHGQLIDGLGSGSTVKGISLPDLKKIEFLLPSILEQQAIAGALSDADALIESLAQLITKKRHIKQGAMQQLLTGKKRLPGFSGEWEMKRLGFTATLKARIGWQGLKTTEYMDSGDYYLVTGTEFKEGYIDWNNCHYVDESRYKQDKYIQLKEHDVLVTKDGTIGKVALITDLPSPATLNSGVFVIRPTGNAFYPKYFYYLLSSITFTNFLSQLSAGSTINHLYQKDFVNFTYCAPIDIEEQTAIATILSDMDTEIAVLEAKLAKARQIKQGMMQELLTGKIRLVESGKLRVESGA